MRVNPLFLIAVVSAHLTIPASAADSSETIDALKREIEALDHKLRVLECKQELDKRRCRRKGQAGAHGIPGRRRFQRDFVRLQLRVQGARLCAGGRQSLRFRPGGPRAPTIGSKPAIHRTGLPDTTSPQPRRWFPGPGRSSPPNRPVTFRDGAGLGAFELAARVHGLDVDDDAFPIYANPATAATEALSLGVGLNWHLNRNLKLSFNHGHTDFKAEAGNPFDDESEDLFLGRVQFAF